MSDVGVGVVRHGCRGWWLFAVFLGLSALPALLSAATRNHNFDLVVGSITVCEDGATFDGAPTAAPSLNLLMTSQVFDATGTTLLATGNTHTFTAVGEVFTFVVPYPIGTVNVGDTVVLSISDAPPSIQGAEGDAATATVMSCPSAPTLPGWGMALLALALAGAGAGVLARGARRRANGQPA